MAAQLRGVYYSCKSSEHTVHLHLSICLKWMAMDLSERLVSLFQCTDQHCKTFRATTQFIPANIIWTPYTTDLRKAIGKWYYPVSIQLYWTNVYLKFLNSGKEAKIPQVVSQSKMILRTKGIFLSGCVLFIPERSMKLVRNYQYSM